MEISKADVQRFWTKVSEGSSASCWLWLGSKNLKGYGHFRLNGKIEQAHRAAWLVAYGEIPKGLHVLHACDNPPCVNRDHLFLGTNGDNSADKISKGRQAKGKKIYSTKLTPADVLEMRRLYATGKVTHRILAKMFHVNHSQIYRVVNKLDWKYI